MKLTIESDALQFENNLIKEIGLINLFNKKTNDNAYKPLEQDLEEHRMKISQGLKDAYKNGLVHPLKGKKLGEETRMKMSISHKGKIFSDKHRINISKSLSNRVLTEEHRKNISKSQIGKKSNQIYVSKFLTYSEAKEWIWINKSNLNSKKDWIEFTSLNDFPSFLPKNAYLVYKNKNRGWVSWIDFLNIVK